MEARSQPMMRRQREAAGGGQIAKGSPNHQCATQTFVTSETLESAETSVCVANASAAICTSCPTV